MRDELARVLAYPKIESRLAFFQISAVQVLAGFDQQSQPVAIAPRCPLTCADPDDQKFIDLAVTHQATLLSKDKAVISLKKRLLRHGVKALRAIE